MNFLALLFFIQSDQARHVAFGDIGFLVFFNVESSPHFCSYFVFLDINIC